MEKIKLQAIVQTIAGDAFKNALATARPKYKGKSDQEIAEILGLSEFQYQHFIQQALGRAVSQMLEDSFTTILTEGNSIEVPHQFNVFVHASSARVNKNGESLKKLSVRTRRALKAKINS